MKGIIVLIFAGVFLCCNAGITKRQIVEERYPSQFGNQFFGNQNPNFFQFPGQGSQFNQFPSENGFNQQQFNQNQRPNNNQQFNPNQNQQQFNPNQNQQQINQNQRPNQNQQQNNQQQQGAPNQAQQPVTQTAPTQPPTTLSPAVENCRDGCTGRTTAEYNPVCGSDTLTYHNAARLECARDCGVSVSLQRRGTCGQAGRS